MIFRVSLQSCGLADPILKICSAFWTDVQFPRTVRPMSYDVQVLRAMLRLARKRQVADVEAMLARAGGAPSDVRAAWRRLDAQGLVERLPNERARLTMSGFAVAVSTIERRAKPAGQRPLKRRAIRAA
jgi:hypothetical protein